MKYTLVLLLACLSSLSIGQSKNVILTKHQKSKFSVSDGNQSISTFTKSVADEWGLESENDLQLKSQREGKNGLKHLRYRQTYQNLPVVGGDCIIHTKNDKVQFANGNLLPDITLDTNPGMLPYRATEIAMNLTSADQYFWETHPGEEVPSPELCVIDVDYPTVSGEYRLAYKIDIYATTPLSKIRYYIDASNGQLISQESLLCHESVPGSGKTLYYGEQTFMVDSLAPDMYQLIDKTRGNGNTVYRDENGRKVVTDDDNYWDLTAIHNRSSAIDAHFCTTKYYDFLLEHFDWFGLDGNGRSMDCVVNYRNGSAYVNAFWDGNFAWFGDGDCHYGPLTSIDVVAHEFTHGLTDFTSDLIYRDESGALNESMSDIFGKALEYLVTPDEFNWYIGKTFNLTSYVNPFRNMADPTELGDPKYYGGTNWYVGTNDNGGVHSNSGVLNYWFYLLTDGGAGTTEKGTDFDVVGLGIEKAIQVPFLMQMAYLTTTSNYNDAYNASIFATTELFGEESAEMNSVKEAWKAVGMPRASNEIILLDLAVDFELDMPNTCAKDELIDITVRVYNVGVETMEIGDTIKLIFNDIESMPFNFILDSAFEPGADTLLVLEDAFKLIAEGRLSLNVRLDNNDKVQSNNTDRYNFNNYFSPDPDLSLTIAIPTSIDCYLRTVPITAFIRNSSCSTVPAGSTYSILMKKGTEVIEEYNYTLNSELQVGGTLTQTLGYEYEGTVAILDFELLFGNDVSMENNFSTFNAIFVENSINAFYLNPFETTADKTNKLELNEDNYFGIVNYNGNTYLGTTGQNNDINNICPAYQDNFRTDNAAIFEMCVDFADFKNVELSFDLIQLRNDMVDSFPENADAYCMTLVEWNTDTESGSLLINDQEEGLLTHYDIPLPDNFTGNIQFSFYNHLGTLSFVSASALDRYDYNLIDNLVLSGETISSSVESITESNIMTIYPNPSNSTIQVQVSKGESIGTLKIMDLYGKNLFSQSDFNIGTVIDISRYSGGLYLVEFVPNDSKKRYLSKFVNSN